MDTQQSKFPSTPGKINGHKEVIIAAAAIQCNCASISALRNKQTNKQKNPVALSNTNHNVESGHLV